MIKGATDIESDICFLPMVTNRSLTMIRLHAHYKNQFLFTHGGLMGQPNTYLEAMEVIDNAC